MKAGAPFSAGVRLFLLLEGPRHPFAKMLQCERPAIHAVLKLTLSRRAGVSPSGVAVPLENTELPKAAAAPKLREDWPFLRDPSCPPEMKILAANKITAYHTFVGAHDRLFDCTTPAEQFAAVRDLIENYIENRSIVKEFKYYKEHGHVLGDHPIFNEMKAIKALRRLNVVDLLKMKDKLQHNIWRIESEIRKGAKKHLELDRKQRLQEKQRLLAEVDRLVQEFTA